MKYLVNRETKEHKVASEIAAAAMTRYPGFVQDWNIVEADDEGWIPWSGGKCPLPDGHKYCFTTDRHPSKDISDIYSCPENNSWTYVTAYRPILSETAEKEEVSCEMQPANVFDRLKSAIAASESIPSIIAEIDALLPEGYCVVKRSSVKETHIDGIGGVILTEQPAEDMSDWRNWREGDLVTYGGDTDAYHWWTYGRPYVIEKTAIGLSVTADDGEQYHIDGKRLARSSRFRFHSRPAKVAE